MQLCHHTFCLFWKDFDLISFFADPASYCKKAQPVWRDCKGKSHSWYDGKWGKQFLLTAKPAKRVPKGKMVIGLYHFLKAGNWDISIGTGMNKFKNMNWVWLLLSSFNLCKSSKFNNFWNYVTIFLPKFKNKKSIIIA